MRRRTFIEDLVSRANSSTRARHQGPSSIRRILVTTRLEASVSMVEKIREVATTSGVPMDEDRASAMEVGEPKVVYNIYGKEVTKKRWLQLQ